MKFSIPFLLRKYRAGLGFHNCKFFLGLKKKAIRLNEKWILDLAD